MREWGWRDEKWEAVLRSLREKGFEMRVNEFLK